MSFFARVANLGKGLWKVGTRAPDRDREAALDAELAREAAIPRPRAPEPAPAKAEPPKPDPAPPRSDDVPRKRTL